MVGQLGLQAPLQGLLEQRRQKPVGAGQRDLASIDLLEQAVQATGDNQLLHRPTAQPVDRTPSNNTTPPPRSEHTHEDGHDEACREESVRHRLLLVETDDHPRGAEAQDGQGRENDLGQGRPRERLGPAAAGPPLVRSEQETGHTTTHRRITTHVDHMQHRNKHATNHHRHRRRKHGEGQTGIGENTDGQQHLTREPHPTTRERHDESDEGGHDHQTSTDQRHRQLTRGRVHDAEHQPVAKNGDSRGPETHQRDAARP